MKNLRKLNSLLPLVAIGTVADCQSILEPTNRLLVSAGLKILNQKQFRNYGLESLLDSDLQKSKIDSGYTFFSQDLAYFFSPVLNAAGRISHAQKAINLLTSNTKKEAEDLAFELLETNQNRKLMVKEIIQEIEREAEDQFKRGQPLIWLEGDWNKGLIGLIASRLVSSYDIPVIVISLENTESTASLRAPEGYHLPKAMTQLPEDFFIKKGGHPGAAGFKAKTENLPKIKIGLGSELKAQSNSLKDKQSSFIPENYGTIPADLESLTSQKDLIWLTESDLNKEFFQEVVDLDPFGQDFLMPKFVFNFSNFQIRWLGQEKLHLKLSVKDLQIAVFNLEPELKKQFLDTESTSKTIWCLVKISQNAWKNKVTWELIADKIWVY